MLTVETIGRIRREFFVQGKTIKEIARDLRVSRNTVRKVVRSGLLGSRSQPVSLPDSADQLYPCRTTDLLPHRTSLRLPPSGSKLREATAPAR